PWLIWNIHLVFGFGDICIYSRQLLKTLCFSAVFGNYIDLASAPSLAASDLGWDNLFSASSRWLEGIRKWYYNAAGFNKLGLMRDDTIHENDDVKEAIRRLPENLYNDRVFRIKRALDLSMRQQILPKEQWTKYEEDKSYLEPYLKEVIRERKEREEWAKK
uniref:Cytochrome b-c1 complex subunit 7 n=3 Tax=Bos TaxID=9903 RepID=A0A4W2FHT1_BOBOX